MPVESHAEANDAMNEFFYAVKPKLDERLETLLRDAKNLPIPPQSIAEFVEIVYANNEKFTAEELEPVVGLAKFGGDLWFLTLRDGRGNAIARFLAGEALEDAPEPEDRYKEPPELPEMMPEGAAPPPLGQG